MLQRGPRLLLPSPTRFPILSFLLDQYVSPGDVQTLLLQTGLFDTALALSKKCELSLVPVFESLAGRYILKTLKIDEIFCCDRQLASVGIDHGLPLTSILLPPPWTKEFLFFLKETWHLMLLHGLMFICGVSWSRGCRHFL